MQKVSVILIATLIAALGVYLVSEGPQIDGFSQWKAQFGRHYDSAEEVYRRAIFAQNRATVEAHNANPTKSYQMGLTQFADLSQREFEAYYLTALIVPEGHRAVEQDETNAYVHKLGDVDWAAQGAVTTVKNQGQCGSCWAFSAVGGVQGLYQIQDKVLRSFSAQQLIDCSQRYGNAGCNGGLMGNAFQFIKENGICEESDYPYLAKLQNCQKKTGPFKITGYSEAKTCDQLANLVTKGPVSVALNASNWYLYKSGIFNNCPQTYLNFAALLVGVTKDYWKIKNDWGADWGENGYIRLTIGNTCGVCSMAAIPYK